LNSVANQIRAGHRSASFACRIFLLAGFLLPVAPAVFAAGTNDDWLMRPWQTEDGLPDNSVNGVAQTADGYLWVGTPSGLARFDGLQFENIPLTNVIALPNRGIITMLRGRHGALWLAMDRGAVVRLSGNSSRAFVKDLPTYNPNGMAEDAEGGLWIAYRGGTVYRVKGEQTLPITSEQGLPDGPDICALTTDNRGRLWFAKAGQVGVFSNGLFRVVQQLEAQPMRLAAAQDGGVWVCCGFNVFKCDERRKVRDFGEFHPETSGNVATVMLEDHAGDVWIGTSFNGLYRHGPAGFQAIPTSHSGIISLIEDRERNLWAGTSGGGLNRIRRPAITLEGAETGLPFPSVVSVCEAADGTIWAATQNGVLVHKVGDRWNSIPVSDEWPGDAACVNADARGAVWIGTRTHGLFCWRDGKFADWGNTTATNGQTFHTLLVGKNGDLWLGQESPNAVLHLHDGKITTFPISSASRIIRAMAEDTAGNIWAGTSRGNLLRLRGDKVTDATPRPPEDLAPIRCLYTTPDGALWIGYAGWGVGCLKDGRYTEVSKAQGLFDDSISHIVADGQGWLWFGARGIFKVRQQDFEDLAAGKNSRVRSVHYGRGDGLPSLQGTFGDSPDVLRSRDGRLWIPMQTGLVVADPAKLSENAEPPPTLLTRVLVDDLVVAQYQGILPGKDNVRTELLGRISKDSVLHLPPGHRSIKFEFAAFSFNAPENIQFRHQLAGFEDDWVESGAVRNATYPRLANGTYNFQVTACNGDGNWNQAGAQITLVVAPFFWRTWWFRLAAVAAFTLSVIAIVRYVSFRRLRARLHVLEQQAALQRERARIAKDIHDDLGANLTQIAFLGELANQDRGEPNLVGERIGKISATARQSVKSLDEIVWAVNPRNDTLAHLLDYAGQFALDYLRTIGIRCRLDFPAEIPARELSTDLRHNLFLAIKEALHNIFKHANATEVWLRAIVDQQALEIVIEDNGRGFAHAPDDALADGLRNMQQRMADIGGGFRVESAPGKGTKINLRLPWPETK
jgi:signal transduction histidine kinase/ligand-binding sensor domain-containing protein